MRYLIGLGLVAFSLCGLMTWLAGIRGLWSQWRRRAFLRSAVGEIISLKRSEVSSSDSSTAASVYHPVLRFKTASGEVKTFLSPFGTGPSPKYKVGMTIPVLYDPDNVLPPMIDSWFAIWGGHVMLLIAGLVFLGGAALGCAVFIRQV